MTKELKQLKEEVSRLMEDQTADRELNFKLAAQKIIGYIHRRLNEQGVRAMMVNEWGHNTKCAYRSGALKCAAGWLIEDDNYVPEMENRPAEAIIEKYDSLAWLKPFKAVVGATQGIHDSRYMWGDQDANSARETAFRALIRVFDV